MVVSPEINKSVLQSALGDVINKDVAVLITEPNLEDVFIALTQKR